MQANSASEMEKEKRRTNEINESSSIGLDTTKKVFGQSRASIHQAVRKWYVQTKFSLLENSRCSGLYRVYFSSKDKRCYAVDTKRVFLTGISRSKNTVMLSNFNKFNSKIFIAGNGRQCLPFPVQFP